MLPSRSNHLSVIFLLEPPPSCSKPIQFLQKIISDLMHNQRFYLLKSLLPCYYHIGVQASSTWTFQDEPHPNYSSLHAQSHQWSPCLLAPAWVPLLGDPVLPPSMWEERRMIKKDDIVHWLPSTGVMSIKVHCYSLQMASSAQLCLLDPNYLPLFSLSK